MWVFLSTEVFESFCNISASSKTPVFFASEIFLDTSFVGFGIPILFSEFWFSFEFFLSWESLEGTAVFFRMIFCVSVAKDLASTLEVSTTLGSIIEDSIIGGLYI